MSEPAPLSVTVPPELLEAIAERTAEIVLERVRAEARATREPKFLSVQEAAELYRCKPQRIYELLSARRLTGVKEGGRVLLLREELEGRLGIRRSAE